MAPRLSSQLLAGLLVYAFCFLEPCRSTGTFEVKMNRYQSSCSDNLGMHDCDTYFYLCIDKPGSVDINSCDYQRYGPSDHYDNTNTMNFEDNVGGISNPISASTDRFEDTRMMFVVETIDKEKLQSDEHLVTLGKTVYYTPAADKDSATWKSSYMYSGSYHVWFQHRSFCDAFYYTTSCDVYCKARDDNQGHYTCNPTTGQKKCMRGWTGDNCDSDINECALGPCYHNATCTNLPGSYQCDCPNGFTGLNCDLIDSQCHSSPCQHEGECTGTMDWYNCTCTFEWEGTNCETHVDFCVSNPCKNNATCFDSVGQYTCVCAPGWNGTHCEIEVNACDSAPCQNGGSCMKESNGTYSCTCPSEYEGQDCQMLKNPCYPNPCQNSGTCNKTSYDTYNCTCVYGWDGVDCESYINVTASSQTDQNQDEGAIWLPILIAIISAGIIVAGILLLLFIRRRRQKKEAQERLTDRGDVVEVANHENMAFHNALYDQTNRANSVIDQANRPPMPVPPPTTMTTACKLPDDFLAAPPSSCTSAKAKQFEEEEGAVGGTNPYQEIAEYLEPVKSGKTDVKQNMAGTDHSVLDTRSMAGASGGVGSARISPYANGDGLNHYADFEELKRRSIAVREVAAPDNTVPKTSNLPEEENHYQDLDEVCLAIQDDTQDAVRFSPPPVTPPSHYDIPSSYYDTPRSSSADVTPPGNHLGEGYMNMSGHNASQEEGTDEEEEGVGIKQEDIEQLRQEVMKRSVMSEA